MYKGFSLIEIIICLAIMSILTCIAYPSYTNYLVRARRVDGKLALYDLANRLEQYYSQNQTYKTATIGSGNSTDVLVSALSPEKFYVLSIKKQTDNDYFLEAQPLAGQQKNDKLCQTLTLDSDGITAITATNDNSPQGNVNECW